MGGRPPQNMYPIQMGGGMKQGPQSSSLGLWMNGVYVGAWTKDDALMYDEKCINSSEGIPLSLPLPFLPRNPNYQGKIFRTFFEICLPDSWDIRQRFASRYQVDPVSAFELLAQIGRDCVG